MSIYDKSQYGGALFIISDRANKLYESAVNHNNTGKLDKTDILHKMDEIQAYVDVIRELIAEDEGDKSDTGYKPDETDNSPFLHNSDNTPKPDLLPVTAKMEALLNRLEAERLAKSDNTPKSYPNLSDALEAHGKDLLDKSDKPLEKGSVRDLRVIESSGYVLHHGDYMDYTDIKDKVCYTFQSVTHPRKVNTIDSNGHTHTYYASVHNVGIWDVRFHEWTFRPSWDESDIERIENDLRNSDNTGNTDNTDKG